jgi:Icc-related predicted phosphoesterase
VVIGGDITGKTIIPIIRTRQGWSATYRDRRYEEMTADERAGLEQAIRDNGEYPFVGERDEVLALEHEGHRERVFVDVVTAGLRRWGDLAQERLAGTGIRCFVTPGNDDVLELDSVIQESPALEFVEGRCVRLTDGYEMLTTGYANPTPWKTPRELPEPALQERIESMFAGVEHPESLIAVLHPPPHGTQLDQAPAIDGEFKIQHEGGSTKFTSVGSTAVRNFIVEHQPLVSLHGHVHESRGVERLGRTLCVNPGSEYNAGSLLCAVVTLTGPERAAVQLVSG